ncbi:TetR/AcrR family transcriptional regulator [Streptomyces sp. BBFR51]|uniref:TetR/AcrR family transcriptional regulator n=1 Tax=Streptomyces sp. BBFR51 TaxID=3372856 RepID=UPI0037DDCDC0
MLQMPDRRPSKPQRKTRNEASADKSRSGDRRSRLVAAALKLFSVRAYDSVFIDDICDEAEVAHGLVSYYFGSKRNLYVAVLEQVFADLQAFTKPQPEDGDAAAQIRGIIRRHFEYFRGHPQVLLGLLRASPGDTAEATIRESVHHGGVTTFMQLLDLPPGEASPFLRSALSGCLGFTDRVIIDWLTHDEDVPIDLVVDLCTNMTISTIIATVPDFSSSSS